MSNALDPVYQALKIAGRDIYQELKTGRGLSLVGETNDTGDDQIGLDIIADNAFVDALSGTDGVKSIMSEERPDLIGVEKGPYTIALDPLDGSKSALYGVPCGAIFGVFENITNAGDFHGGNIIASGFFVFGITLELYFADSNGGFLSKYNEESGEWSTPEKLAPVPSANVFAVNVSGINYWDTGLREHYLRLHAPTSSQSSPPKGRWFASLVLDMKRLALQGGVFAYPANAQKNYEKGHLRLVYEGIPMAFFIETLGGASSDGRTSLLLKTPSDLHEKTPVFLGEIDKIHALQSSMSEA